MDLANRILSKRAQGRPTLVAIDGRSAAGKSTLARQLAAALPGSVTFSVDDFHHPREHRYRQGEDSAQGYYDDAFDMAAIVELVLKPLRNGPYPAHCPPSTLDLVTNLPSTAPPIRILANAIVIFEGIFTLRRELNSYWDHRILVDIAAETCIQRALARDPGPAEAIDRKYRIRYEPAWLLYVEAEHPESNADIMIAASLFPSPPVR
jgi:uridine kinase